MLQHIIHKLFSIEKDEVASDAINPSRRTTPNVDSFPMMSRRTCESPIAAAEPQQASRTSSYLFCRHPWLLAWPRATNLGLSAARPPTLRVCARAVRATRSPRAHGSLPYGQPSASVGLRIRAYSSPLRGLLPAACSARPTPPSGLMRGQRGAWSACVTPGQRRTPYARSSGLLPSRARPRPSSPSASAGGKGSLRRQLSSHHTPPASASQPLHQQPTPSSARQKPSQSRDSPSCDPRTRQLHRERLRAPGSPPDATCHPGRRRT